MVPLAIQKTEAVTPTTLHRCTLSVMFTCIIMHGAFDPELHRLKKNHFQRFELNPMNSETESRDLQKYGRILICQSSATHTQSDNQELYRIISYLDLSGCHP
ncbi:hypothetical protein TNCV_3403641 [Trichonephila clavipes]|nr:hypothetical protein TNCV_3403641 [Trichonephila clavipes]